MRFQSCLTQLQSWWKQLQSWFIHFQSLLTRLTVCLVQTIRIAYAILMALSCYFIVIRVRITTASCKRDLLSERVVCPQICEPFLSFQDGHGGMLRQVVQITVGIFHADDKTEIGAL